MRGALLCAALLVPLTYFPWTFEPLEINKQTVLVVCVVLAAFAWLGASVAERRVALRGEWVLGAIAFFVLVPLVATGTYDQPYMSFIGSSAQEYTSVLTHALLAVLVFLSPFVWGTAKSQVRLWTVMLLAAGVVAAAVIASYLGVNLPSVTGAANLTALYLLCMSLLGCTLWLTSRGTPQDVLPAGTMGGLVRGAIVLTTIVTLWMLLAIDYTGLWIAALFGTCALFTFALVRAHEFPRLGRFILPMMLFVSATVFLFLPTAVQSPFVPEVALTQRAAWNVASQALHGNALFFGTGPGTYAFNYAQYHSADVNATEFWDVTFDRAQSHVMTLLPTYGVVGLALYLFVMIGVGSAAVRMIARARSHEEWKLAIAPTIAWVALAAAQFFLPMNMTLQFVYWLLTGILLVHASRTVRQYDFAASPRAGIVSSFVFVVLFVGLTMTLFVSVLRYRAEIAFAEAVALDKSGGELDAIIVLLDRAATINSWNDVYYRNLGHALLLKTGVMVNAEDGDPTRIQQFIAASLNAGKVATSLSSGNVDNWELRGSLYREVAPLISGADEFAISSWQNAVALAPNNPKEYVGLARAYIARADRLSVLMNGDDATSAAEAQEAHTAALVSAEGALSHAVTLKSDYTPAQYYLAQVYERQDKVSDAVKSMEALKAVAPNDVGVAMQLGLLYLRQGKNAVAKTELERALTIAPNYANAHWYLATIYEQENDIAAAISEVEKIAETDPTNALVTQRLERLRAGEASAEIPDPVDATDGQATEGDGSTAAQTSE